MEEDILADFSIMNLANKLKEALPEIYFAYLFGSSFEGKIKNSSDVDLAVYLDDQVCPDLILRIVEPVESLTHATCDLTILNTASEILRFEALKGRLLFVRDDKIEEYTRFYSLTCREYEDTIAWMNKQMSLRGYT